jgi:ubiquinone/menaquinone biosynthesis C-methylase UbiE
MSQFENYHETSRHYDLTRVPVGLDIITAALTRFCAPLDQLTLLDAGCGTGAYTAALLPYVSRIEAIDLNPSMLAVARKRFTASTNLARVRFQPGSVDAAPLEDAAVGAVMVNQVLHHLGDGAHTDWVAYRQAFQELYRVLQPGGVLILNSCSHQQLEQGFWWSALIPDAFSQVKRYLPSDTALADLFADTGFEIVDHQVPYDEVLQGEAYFKPEGVLDPRWRSGDSAWSLVSEATLNHVLIEVTELLRDDLLLDFMQKADKHRPKVGQTTFTIARKKRLS